MPADDTIRWLLAGDPAIRWQGAAERTVERERRKVARDGWGALLLAQQGPSGTWAEATAGPLRIAQGQDLVRAGAPRHSQPLEHPARNAGPAVVGRESNREGLSRLNRSRGR